MTMGISISARMLHPKRILAMEDALFQSLGTREDILSMVKASQHLGLLCIGGIAHRTRATEVAAVADMILWTRAPQSLTNP